MDRCGPPVASAATEAGELREPSIHQWLHEEDFLERASTASFVQRASMDE